VAGEGLWWRELIEEKWASGGGRKAGIYSGAGKKMAEKTAGIREKKAGRKWRESAKLVGGNAGNK
jgi:hypothetical protein